MQLPASSNLLTQKNIAREVISAIYYVSLFNSNLKLILSVTISSESKLAPSLEATFIINASWYCPILGT